MKQKNYSVNVHWDKRYPKAGTNLCPVQLALNINGKQFKIGLRLYAAREDFEKAIGGRGGSNEAKELRRQITGYVAKAEGILERMPNPNGNSFQRLFKSETDLFVFNKTDATFLFREKIDQLYKEERIKTAQNCEHALKSLKKYKKDLYFEDIDESFLKGYKAWMQVCGNSGSTAQIYLRNLRAIFNLAIKQGYISEKHYPFRNYTIGTSAKSKSVLYPPQLKLLWEYKPTTLREERAKDFFFFCYLCNGMNFKDAVYLTNKDIRGSLITFVREKTKRTNTVSEKEIKVHLHEEVKKIIDKWGNPKGAATDFIFPVFNNYSAAIDRERRRKTYQRWINRSLNAIGVKLGFEDRLCLNLARHSFATRLKLDGTPLAFISDAMGHANSKTTEHYMKSIPDEMYKNISKSLLDF